MRKLIIIVAIVAISIPVTHAARDGWVTVDKLNRRTCPATTCGVVGRLFFREKAIILEEKNGWARITPYYHASCANGISQYVDSGNKKCESNNGINNGQFAEWVSSKYLSSNLPKNPAAYTSANYAIVKDSDDFRIHKDAFAKAANELISSGRCSANDFQEMAGWTKSYKHKSQPIYFMYCGGLHSSNQIYLNAVTGKITR